MELSRLLDTILCVLVINNRIIICFGQITRQGTYTTVTYPISYSTFCSPVTSYFNDVDQDSNERYIQTKSLTNFVIHTYARGSGSQLWISVGY